jgi:hypothetical protein
MLPENVFDAEALIRICQMREGSFAKAYGMTTVEVDQPAPANYYHFKDNGSDILAVAHLDTVAGRKARDGPDRRHRGRSRHPQSSTR